MANEFNIFEHKHDHDCDHDHDHGKVEHLDPAQQSLADALKVSFGILKIVMLGLLAIFLFSGIFNVKSGEKAVKLRFGKIITDNAGEGLEAGGPYFALPYPLEEPKKIQTTQRSIDLGTQFWWSSSADDAGKSISEIADANQGPLDPVTKGSMISGDANIVHTQWRILYQVSNITAFLQQVGSFELADVIVRNAAEQAAVYAVAQTTADEVINGRPGVDVARVKIQEILSSMNTGLEVVEVTAPGKSMPLSVRSAYEAVIGAVSEQGQKVETARQERARILGSAAGEGYEDLLKLINAFETAQAAGDKEKLAQLDKQLDEAYRTLKIGEKRIGGEASRIINEALGYQTQVSQALEGEARRFNDLLDQYRANPQIVLNRLWFDTKEQILTSPDVEVFYAPTDAQTYLDLNRRPDVEQAREKARLDAAAEAQRARNQ
jgi:membrane protease subunit HflK